MKNEDIYDLVEHHGTFSQSEFQSRYFVVNSHVTNYRRIRQALLEIEARVQSKRQIERSVKREEAQLAIHQRDFDNETDELKKNLIACDVDQSKYDLNVYQKRLRQTEQELETYAEIVKELVPDMDKLIEMNKENPEEERRYWIARIGKQAAMDLMTIGKIGQGNMDSIAMMSLEDQEQTVKVALKYNAVMNKGIANLEKRAIDELQLSYDPKNEVDYIDRLLEHSDMIEDKKIDGESI